MGAMVVEVGPEIEQLAFEIRRSPEQNVIQILPSNGADWPFHERMRQWNVGDGLDFCHVQYPEVGLPLVEPIKRIVIGAEEVWHPALPSNGAVEHPTKCDTIDRAGMDAEANDPARVLIHDHQNPVGPQHGRFAPEQIHAPKAIFHVAEEREPGPSSRMRFRPVTNAKDTANHILLDDDAESQGDLLGDAGTAPIWITLLHFDDR